MKIKSAVILSSEEEDKLFNIVKDVCLAPYNTIEEQNLAIENAKVDFVSLLNRYVQKSFKLGKKYKKAKMLAESTPPTSV